MSRTFLIASLITAFTSLASAEGRFAQPPPHAAPRVADIMEAPAVVDRAKVRAKLAANRAANIQRFRNYQAAGVFPSNTYQANKLNVWLDEDGHFCAAATIIKMSGMDDLVNKVAEQNNFIRLADVKQGPLMDWILTSGLTQDEIAAIQEPFMPVVEQPMPEPVLPIVVDSKLRKAEDARLRAKYKSVDRMIVKHTKKSLDLATDRLMKHPRLAWTLVDSQNVGLE